MFEYRRILVNHMRIPIIRNSPISANNISQLSRAWPAGLIGNSINLCNHQPLLKLPNKNFNSVTNRNIHNGENKSKTSISKQEIELFLKRWSPVIAHFNLPVWPTLFLFLNFLMYKSFFSTSRAQESASLLCSYNSWDMCKLSLPPCI